MNAHPRRYTCTALLVVGLLVPFLIGAARGADVAAKYYLPDANASRIVSVGTSGTPSNEITVLTQAVAVKENAPPEVVKKFGEVYAFSPNFIAVREGRPVRLTFWNLQPDDDHDFMLTDSDGQTLMFVELPPLKKTSYLFTFHRPGLFNFYCTVHQPDIAGQILALPPTANK